MRGYSSNSCMLTVGFRQSSIESPSPHPSARLQEDEQYQEDKRAALVLIARVHFTNWCVVIAF